MKKIWKLLALCSIIVMPLTRPRQYNFDPVRVVHTLTWLVLHPAFRFFLRIKTINAENYKKVKGPAIFVSNHESYLDPFLISASIPLCSHFHAIHFLTHEGLFENKFLNILLKIYGSFSGRAYKGDESVLKIPSKLLSRGISIGIFKEWCYEIHPGKKYVSKIISAISMRNKVPIIPVFTYGIYNGGISWSIFLRRMRVVRVVYGQPIYPKEGSNEERINTLLKKSFLQTKLTFMNSIHEEEKSFWNSYARFYHHLEKSDSYNELLREIHSMLPERITGKWIDLGSGSGKIVDILVQKADKNKTEILSSDMNLLMLEKISNRFSNEKIVKVMQMDLSLPLNLKNSYFDGISANLVLPYVIHHHGRVGKKSLISLLENLYKVLRPGGVLLWSTPKHNVNFMRVFIQSWRNILDFKHLENLYYGSMILWHAIKIQKKGISGIYSFLKPEEIQMILKKIGFTDIRFKRSMAGQVDVIICKKK